MHSKVALSKNLNAYSRVYTKVMHQIVLSVRGGWLQKEPFWVGEPSEYIQLAVPNLQSLALFVTVQTIVFNYQ